MFGSLLKKKLQLEREINQNQKQYLSLKLSKISQEICDDEKKNSDVKNVQKVLTKKSDTVKDIKHDYELKTQQSKQLKISIDEAKEIAQELNRLVDVLCGELKIEMPPDLIKKEQLGLNRINESHEGVENNDEDAESDKENSILEQDSFSPKVLIRKSILNSDSAACTPAIKSKIPRSNLNID
jgi:hypothetical protein